MPLSTHPNILTAVVSNNNNPNKIPKMATAIIETTVIQMVSQVAAPMLPQSTVLNAKYDPLVMVNHLRFHVHILQQG